MDACVYYRTEKKEGKVRLGGTRVHGRGYGRGYNGFFPKKHCPALLKSVPVYQFTRLYPGTGTDTAGTGRGYTGTGCTRRVLANH
jgi:hypothetical protein